MDDTTSIWDVMAARGAVGSLAVADGEGGEPREAGTRPAAAGSSTYLAISGKDCDGEKKEKRVEATVEEWVGLVTEIFGPPAGVHVEDEPRYEIAACGCRSWFCPHCCVGRGLALRERLIPVLHRFQSLLMWTFTIDPALFESPTKAYEYVKSKRCISNVMRRLRERGNLHSDKFFCIIEWQKKSEMPHFHVLADASFIPFDEVCELWNRYRPPEAGPVQGDRPGFGSVRFSAPRFRSVEHAARYACKYLIKHPEHGYPAWVLDSTGEVHRYSTSRGFWGDQKRRSQSDSVDEAVDRHYMRKTVRDRLRACGQTSVLLQLVGGVDEETGEVVQRRKFVAILPREVSEIALALGLAAPEGKRRFCLTGPEAGRLFLLNSV